MESAQALMAFAMGFAIVGLRSLTSSFGNANSTGGKGVEREMILIAEELVGLAAANIKGSRASNPPEVLGRVSSRLAQSIGRDPSGRTAKKVAGGFQVKIGPQRVAYAAIHEFGGFAGAGRNIRIPARPYMGPALAKKLDEIVDRLGSAYVGSVLEAT